MERQSAITESCVGVGLCEGLAARSVADSPREVTPAGAGDAPGDHPSRFASQGQLRQLVSPTHAVMLLWSLPKARTTPRWRWPSSDSCPATVAPTSAPGG